MKGIRFRGHFGAYYRLAALVLVAVYIGAFDAWRSLVNRLGEGRADALPIVLIVLASLGAVTLALLVQRRGREVRPRALAGGIVLAVAALFLSDPAFPAKRIHVLEYAVLALVVGRALSADVRGRALLWATALATAVLGSHDELIQGLLADRTFGLRDFAIDAIAAVAGVAVGHGLGLFPAEAAGAEARLDAAERFALALLVAGWLALTMAMPGLLGTSMPLWPVVPLAAGGVAWAIACTDAPATGVRRALATLAVLMLATAVEPVLAHAIPLDFH